MEEPALNRQPRPLALLIPWFSGIPAALLADATGAARASHLATGLAAGVAWQLLNRRDLTSRLTFMAVLVTVGLVAAFASRDELVWRDMNTTGLLGTGVVLGLIYAEHYLRWRDRREVTPGPEPSGSAHPTPGAPSRGAAPTG